MLDECDATPCASPAASTLDRTLLRPTVPKGHQRFFHGLRPASVAPRSGSKLRQGRKAQGSNLESWRTTDASHQALSSNAPSCTSWLSPRSQNQPYYPDSSRVVCHSRSGPVRTGSPPSHQDRGDRSSSVLALIGVWNAALGCTLGLARRPLFGETVPAGLYPLRLKGHQVCVRSGRSAATLSPAAVSLKPDTPLYCVSSSQT